MNASEAFKYVEDLKEAGVPQNQAEVHLRVLDNIIESNLATKRDIEELKIEFKRDIKELKIEFKRDIEELKIEFKRDIKELDHKMSIRLGAIMAAGIAIIAFIVKL